MASDIDKVHSNNRLLAEKIPQRRLRCSEGLRIIILHGSGVEMVSAFEVAAFYGRSLANEISCVMGYLRAGFGGYALLYSEGWYRLTEKGSKRRREIIESSHSFINVVDRDHYRGLYEFK